MSHSSSKIKILESETIEEGAQSGRIHEPSASVPDVPDNDPRATAVWRQWLSSMATDAEAALAAAIAYRQMEEAGRERWIQSLRLDAPAVGVPAVALYAPLLAVEEDPLRRQQLTDAFSEEPIVEPSTTPRAWTGRSPSAKVFVLSTPLYLDFVAVLACGVRDGCFSWVRHDPIVELSGVPSAGDVIEGAELEVAPVKTVLDHLAGAVLTHQRAGKSLPEALGVLGDLLDPLAY